MKNSTTSTTDQKLDKILILTIENTENIKEMSKKLNNVGTNQHQHTLALDGLTKNTKLLLEEKTVSNVRLDRLEKWAEQVGNKIGVKLDLRILQID